ncbi:carboxylating nicotinate-nucleotide diphosphorylase [Mariprofundus micogutta]|nr:carboxylating nicotinate-nucleotide diphosphorylase [Mariprofundus micogutta]
MMESLHLPLINLALEEDAAFNDLTSLATIPENASGSARIIAKAEGIMSGISVAHEVFARVDENIVCEWKAADADQVSSGELICELTGPLRSLLSAERTALNFIQHLSGIATSTHTYVQAVKDTDCKIADTRKTAPGLRFLEKQAVLHGGGINHRINLQAGMLIKENHIQAYGSITDAVNACFSMESSVWVEVECETLDEVHEAIAVCPDIILLDNMTPELVSQARAIIPKSILLEASGNITLANAREYAQTGIDRIAIGAITHSSPSLDLSMRITETPAL